MSTKFSFLFTLLLFGFTSFGQLKVHSNGTVSVANTINTGWGLTVAGYSAIRCIDGSTWLRFSPASSNAVIGSSSDIVAFWESGLAYHHLWFSGYTINSDSLLKTNIEPINTGMEVVMQMKPTSYNLKSDSVNYYEHDSYGFLAQDLQQILPDIVEVSPIDGTLGVRMDEIMPFLVSAIQEQQAQIDSLTLRVTELETSVYDGGVKNKSATITTNENGELIELGQNNPNPFRESTTIPYSIPVSSTSAQIIIYDMRGIELESYTLATFGEGQLIIEGSTFKAGMYMYALIVDGNYIDSKRMILSK